jgi:hypothetical protein
VFVWFCKEFVQLLLLLTRILTRLCFIGVVLYQFA